MRNSRDVVIAVNVFVVDVVVIVVVVAVIVNLAPAVHVIAVDATVVVARVLSLQMTLLRASPLTL